MADKYINNSLIRITFDNSLFEKKVEKSRRTIQKFKNDFSFKEEGEKSTKFFDSFSKGVESTQKVINNFDTTELGKKIDRISDEIADQFHGAQAVIDQALRNIVDKVQSTMGNIWQGIAVRPITTGFEEYETQIGAIQTILANTESAGTTLEDVTAALDELNLYADKTIYNFTEMTRNIGTFTAAGVDLDTSVTAIKGIANLAAISGSTSEQASNAMYQLSQALAAGRVSLQDWNSVVNAGMGGKVFQDALVETARKMGVVVDLTNGFRESISGKETWMSSEILLETLKQFADENTELGKTGTEAATKVKTITQLWDTVQESVQSGWTTTWEYIIGDFDQSKELLSALSDEINALLQPAADARNAILDFWATANVSTKSSKANVDALSDADKALDDIAKRVIQGDFGNGQERNDLLTSMGWDPKKVQNRVNELVGVVSSGSSKIADAMDVMTGRDMVLTGFKNIFNFLLQIKDIAEDVWGSLFDPITGENLVELSRDFLNFTNKLKLSEKEVDKWKRIFTGLFSVIRIAKSVFELTFKTIEEVIKSLDFGPVTNAFKKVEEWLGIDVSEDTGILGFFAGLADKITKVADGLEAINIDKWFSEVGKVFSTEGTTIEEKLNALYEAMGLSDSQVGSMNTAFSVLADVVQIVANAIGHLKDIYEGFRDSFDAGKLGDLVTTLGDTFSYLLDFIKGFTSETSILTTDNEGLVDVFYSLGYVLGKVANFILDVVTSLLEFISLPAEDKLEIMKQGFIIILDFLKYAGSELTTFLKDPISHFLDFLEEYAPEPVSKFINTLRGKFEMLGTIVDYLKGVKDKIDTLLGPLKSSMKPFTDMILGEINQNLPKVFDAANTLKKAAENDLNLETFTKKYVPAAQKALDTLAGTAENVAGKVSDAYTGAADTIDDTLQDGSASKSKKILDSARSFMSSVGESSKKMYDWVTDTNNITDSTKEVAGKVGEDFKSIADIVAKNQEEAAKVIYDVKDEPVTYASGPLSGMTTHVVTRNAADVKTIGSNYKSSIKTLSASTKDFKNKVEDTFEPLYDSSVGPEKPNFVEKAEAINESVTEATDDIDSSSEKMESSGEKTKSIMDIFKSAAEKFNDIMSILSEGINTFLTTVDMVLLTKMLTSITGFFSNLSKFTKNLGKSLEDIVSPFEGVTGVLESMQSRIQAGVIQTIAIAIVEIVLALWVLCSLDQNQLEDATRTLMFVFSGLIASFNSLGRMKEVKAGDLAKVVGAITAGVGVVIAAMEKLATFDATTFAQGLLGLGIISKFFGGIIDKLNDLWYSTYNADADVWNSMAMVMLSVASAITILMIPLSVLGSLPIKNIAAGMAAVIIMMYTLVNMVTNQFSKFYSLAYGAADGLKDLAGALIAFAFAINMLVTPLLLIGMIPLAAIFGTLPLIALIFSFAGAFAIVAKSMKNVDSKELTRVGGALMAFAVAVSVLAPSLIMFTILGLKFEEAGMGLLLFAGMLTIIGLAMVGLGKALQYVILDTKSMMVLGLVITGIVTAMTFLLSAIYPFMDIPMDQLFAGFGALSLIIISLAALTAVLGSVKKVDGSVIATLSILLVGVIAMIMLGGTLEPDTIKTLFDEIILVISVIGAIGLLVLAGYAVFKLIKSKKSGPAEVLEAVTPSKKKIKDSKEGILEFVAIAGTIAALITSIGYLVKTTAEIGKTGGEGLSEGLGYIIQAVKDNAFPLAMAVVELIAAAMTAVKSFKWEGYIVELYALFAYLAKVLMILIASGDLINQAVSFALQLLVNIIYILSGFVGSICEALIVLLIGILNGLSTAISNHASEIAAAIVGFLQALGDLVVALVYEVLGPKVGTAALILAMLFAGLWGAYLVSKVAAPLATFGSYLVSIFSSIVSFFKVTALPALAKAFVALVPSIGVFLVAIGLAVAAFFLIKWVWNEMTEYIDMISDRIAESGNPIIDFLQFLVFGFFGGIAHLIQEAWHGIVNFFKGVWEWLTDFWDTHSPSKKMFGLGKNIIQGLINGVKNLVQKAGEAIKEVADKIWDFISDHTIIDEIFEHGKHIIGGLLDGIKEKAKDVGDALKEVGESAVNKFKNFFHIDSPSKLMREMGEYIDQGLAFGIIDETDTVSDAMDTLQERTAKFDPDKAEELGQAYSEALAQGIISEDTRVKDASEKINDYLMQYLTDNAGLQYTDLEWLVKPSVDSYQEADIFSYDMDELLSNYGDVEVDMTAVPNVEWAAQAQKDGWAETSDALGLPFTQDKIDEMQDNFASLTDVDLFDKSEDLQEKLNSFLGTDGMMGSLTTDFDFTKDRENLQNQLSGFEELVNQNLTEYGQNGADSYWSTFLGTMDEKEMEAPEASGKSMADMVKQAKSGGQTWMDEFNKSISDGSVFDKFFKDEESEVDKIADLGSTGGSSIFDMIKNLYGDEDTEGLFGESGDNAFNSFMNSFSSDDNKEDWFQSLQDLTESAEGEVDMSVRPIITTQSGEDLYENMEEYIKAGTVDVSSDARVGIETSGLSGGVDQLSELTQRIGTKLSDLYDKVNTIKYNTISIKAQNETIMNNSTDILNNMGHDIYIEPGTLVGAIGDEMDAYLGTKSVRQSRTNSGRTYGPVKPTFAR